jgi:hypothetical protein
MADDLPTRSDAGVDRVGKPAFALVPTIRDAAGLPTLITDAWPAA